jgi:predicted CXXCH cytochrome family protein
MKKLFFALVIGIVLVAALTSTAFADNGPHGNTNFSGGSTDACAACHRAHTATNTEGYLLTSSTVYGLCTSCHDGTGAYTDVVDGHYDSAAPANPKGLPASQITGGEGDAGYPLFGGGFTNTEMSHTWTGKASYNPAVVLVTGAVTSNHDVTSGTNGTVWGGGAYSTTTRADDGTAGIAMECTSCHDPHGNAGKAAINGVIKSVPTYRLLRYQPSSSNGFELSSTNGGTMNPALSNTATKTFDMLFTNTLSGVVNNVAGTAGGATVLEPSSNVATGTTAYSAATYNDFMANAPANGSFPTKWWYTINTGYAYDPALAAFELPYGQNAATATWVSVTYGLGDYLAVGNRGATYHRPSLTTTGSTSYSCYNPSASKINNPPPATDPGDGSNYIGNCTTFLTSNPITGTYFNNTPARYGTALFCSQCHDRYLEATGSAKYSTGDALFMYQHASGAAGYRNGGGSVGNPNVTCLDCHNAHGTSALENGALSSDPLSGILGDSSILKADDRDMCARCHGDDVNYVWQP